MTATTFKIVGVFTLRAQKQVVAFGDVLHGALERGMKFSVPKGEGQMTGQVAAIEYVDLMARHEGHPALVLHCERPEELETWRELLSEGRVLSLA
jgi:hypothetical protein